MIRKAAAACALALVATVGIADAAMAARLVTFSAPSRFVDPTEEQAATFGPVRDPIVNVLLPKGYERKGERRYPVLFLLHGASSDNRTWLDSGNVGAIAKDFPGVIVMPDGGRFSMYVDWWNNGALGNPRWREFHLNHLREMVERRFRIRPGRRWHAMAGVSMGGQGAMRYAAQLPGYFGSVASISPAMLDMQSPDLLLEYSVVVTPLSGRGYNWLFGPPDDFYATANNPIKLLPNLRHTRVFVSSGNGFICNDDPGVGLPLDPVESEIRRQSRTFMAAARRAEVDVTERRGCGNHGMTYSTRALAQAMDKWGLFRQVEEKPRSWTFATVAPSSDLWHLRFRMRDRVTEVNTFALRGPVLSAEGAGRTVISGDRGCRFVARIPFRLRLPAACTP